MFGMASLRVLNRGVHWSRIGPDRTGLDRRPKWGQGLDRGSDRTGKCPDRTSPGSAFSAQTCKMARSLARSGRAVRHGRAPLVFRARARGWQLGSSAARSARAKRYDCAAFLRKKIKKITQTRFTGPVRRSNPGPNQRLNSVISQTEDRTEEGRSGSVRTGPRTGPVSDRKLHTPST